MKKIDFHIHTIPSDNKEALFEFDIDKFQEYVNVLSLDAVAITNHNLFDLNQYNEIVNKVKNVSVFPGIEIDFEGGHLLLISDNNDLENFNSKCKLITDEIGSATEIKVEKLKEIYGDLNSYLLIPHYDKKPKVSQNIINSLSDYIFVGEVQSPKKFNRIRKESDSLIPVLFSDVRISNKLNLEICQGKLTFIKTNSDSLSFGVIKAALKDKEKVFLANKDNHDFFQVFSNGQDLSYGLNIVIGGRSSGKSFLLNKLREIYDTDTDEKSVKYIKQFDLVRDDEKKFNKRVEKEKSAIRETYLEDFRLVVQDVVGIDRRATNYRLNKYIETLLDFASSEKLQDEFSKAFLFTETIYQIRQNRRKELERLLRAVLLLIENETFKDTISKHLSEDKLQSLFDDLAQQYKETLEEQLKKEWVNEIVKDTRRQLEQKTSSPKIDDTDIDFYHIKLEQEKLRRFNAIAKSIKCTVSIKESEIFKKFKIRAIAKGYDGAQGLHDECGKQTSFSSAFRKYSHPVSYLEELKSIENLEKSELYRYFCKVTYQVLNEYDKNVSGGEMAEFNLLRALQDAKQYEMLLVDEPESSFDNLFLKDNVNEAIKELSKELPVVVVTHNNTVGMLMNPDYVLYTERKIVEGKDVYKVFSGSPGDKVFKTADGVESINSHSIILNALEAGEKAYTIRSRLYNDYKN